MKTKTGIVMAIEKNKAIIMTQSGEFLEVKKNNSILNIGNLYTGEIYTKLPLQKLIATAAVFMFFIFSSVEAYAYYTPVSTFLIEGAGAIEIKINKWDKIISVEGLDNEGKEIIKETPVKHNAIDKGLQKILETTKKTFENEVINEDLTLTIKESNSTSDEEILKNKIDSADLPINIEVVTSHSKKNIKNQNSHIDDSNNSNSKSSISELNKDNKNNSDNDKDDTDIKNNANNNKSNKSNKSNNSNSKSEKNDKIIDNSGKDKNNDKTKDKDAIKSNTNNKKSDKKKK